MIQQAIPVDIRQSEINREKTFGGALSLCAKAAGFDLDKELQQTLGVDKAQFSRWKNGTEGVNWQKLQNLMDICGNHAPVLWMVDQLGYDLSSLRRKQSITEQELDQEKSARQKVEQELSILQKYLKVLK